MTSETRVQNYLRFNNTLGSPTLTYEMSEEHLWNVSVLNRVHLSNRVVICIRYVTCASYLKDFHKFYSRHLDFSLRWIL
jgi:hypothetical protein